MWQSIASSMWTVIEYNLGIIAASMPALRRPLAAIFPFFLGQSRNSSKNTDDESPVDSREKMSGLTRAPSTVSTASTRTSLNDRRIHTLKAKNEAYRSGMRTEYFEGGSGEFDFDFVKQGELEPIPAVPISVAPYVAPPRPAAVRRGSSQGDLVSTRDWQRGGIWKTTEVDVEPESQPGSQRESLKDHMRNFPM